MLARDISPVASSRIFAAIYYKNKPVSYGWNHLKTHPFQAQFSKNKESIYWHAETNAIFNALRVVRDEDLRKMTLYVARSKHLENLWSWGNSKPCSGCMLCSYTYKISKIVYTKDYRENYGIIKI